MNEQTKAKAGQYLSFMLKGQLYGVPISAVREINRHIEITPVPQSPSYVAGVINLRGKVIPVVSLGLRFGMDQAAATKETCIVVIECRGHQVGMVVDAVSAVIELSGGQIEPPPAMGQDEERHGFVTGMGKFEDKLIILVDVMDIVPEDAVQAARKAA